MTNILQKSEAIAREAHAGQLYGERDYIEAHVKPVVTIIRRLGYGALHQATGWLHDTIEDTDLTAADLTRAGFPFVVVRATELLSKGPDVDQDAYLARITSSPYATVAKFADSSANFASTMLLSPDLPDRDFRDWSLGYAANIAFLRPYLPKPDIKN